MKYTFENVYVNKLDLEKLAADLQKDFDEEIKIPSFGGLILKPVIGLLDTEIVGRPVGKDGKFGIQIYPADKKGEDGSMRISIFPKWEIRISANELEGYVTESMTVAEFVKDRRGYNGRLKTNESLLIDWFNESVKVNS